MAITVTSRERLHRRGLVVVAKYLRYGVEPNAFPIAAGAVNEHEAVLAHVTCQAVPSPLLEEADQIGVTTRGVVKERQPYRAIDLLGCRHRRRLRNPVRRVRGAQLTGAQVDRSCGSPEQHLVLVPML